ncbi:MAG: NAD(P)/FAD-dependent oxidoreductase [Candidatus Hermodarchaeota archaeon]
MHIAIIGLGHAGITAATEIHKISPEAEISIFTEESHPFYFRPQLFDVISGSKTPEEIIRYPKEWYKNNKINLYINSPIVNISPSKKELHLQSGQIISYDKLLITTGAKPFIPPVEGINDIEHYTLRNLEDANTIINRVHKSKTSKATIMGCGLLGLELAKALSDRGLDIALMEIFPYLLPRQLDQEGGDFLQHLLNRKFRFSFNLNVKCSSVKQENSTITIQIEDHEPHICDFLLISAGVQPDFELALKAGIKVNKGIIVDRFMRTNVEDIYAAGDVVEVDRSEFPGNAWGIIPPAVDQAKIAARNICGQETAYKGTLPWTTLKVAGIDLTSLGQITLAKGIQQFVDFDYEKEIYRKLFFKEGVLQGAILIGTKQDLSKIRLLTTRKASLEDVKKELDFDSFKALEN